MNDTQHLDSRVTDTLEITTSMLEIAADTKNFVPLLAVVVQLCAAQLAVSMQQTRLLQRMLDSEGQADR